MCEPSPFASYYQSQPAWAGNYGSESPTSTPSVSPKTSIYGGRRGALAIPLMEEHCDQMEQIRRGSISTVFGNMQLEHSVPQLPVVKRTSYYQAVLSPPSSPRSSPSPSPILPTLSLPEPSGEEHTEEKSCRRFQRQIMSRLQVLQYHQQNDESNTSEDDQFTPPPSPGHCPYMDIPESPSRPHSRRSSKRRMQSAGKSSSIASSTAPASGAVSRTGKARRVSVPANSSTSSLAASSSHTSSRGAVKKVSSTAPSRRGSAVSKNLEVLLEGTLFKSGWSWDTAYGKGARGDEC